MTLPTGTRRLFPGAEPELDASDNELLERLLEDGDRHDLGWLTEQVSESRLAEWLESRGARRLSDRSRAFWSLVLNVPLSPRSETSQELWLL